MAWVYLIIAGLLEVVWSFYMKESHGFTRLFPSVVTFSAMAVSLFFLAIALKQMPLGTAYTVWTGIGAIGAFSVGIIVLHESASIYRILAALLILSGLIMMNFAAE